MDISDTMWQKALKRDENVVARRIAGEMILVPIRGKLADMQRIFSLNPVGEYVWERLDGKRSLREIGDEVAANFEVERDRSDADVREFVVELLGAGLAVEVE